MKTVQQRITELKNRTHFMAKTNRVLLLVILISLTINSVLAMQLHKANDKANQPAPIIMSTGNLEKISDNVFEIIPDEQLPALPSHLK